MTFEYVQGQPMAGVQGLRYPQPATQERTQPPGIDPGTAMQIAGQFMGGGGGSGAGFTGAGTAAAPSGGGAGSAIASAGPWAALAAIIFANESYAQKRGYRPESKTEYAKDLASGEVFHTDIEERWLPKLGIEEGSSLSKAISLMSNPLSPDIGKGFERLKGIF